MNPLVMALVATSSFMHASWNLLARRKRNERTFIWRMLFAAALAGALPAMASEAVAHSLSVKAWACVVGSGICCGVYFFSLARAYSSSDFTVVYPIVRSLPVLLVAVGDLLRGRWPTAVSWLGMALVVSGCSLAPLHSLRDLRIRRYLNQAVLWTLLAALGTVGYTLLDKIASEAVKAGPATAARYGYFFFLIAYVVYAVCVKMSRTEDATSSEVGWRLPILAALLSFGSYWLVLWAYQLTQRASYVIAFRQFSVVLGVVFALVIYKERALPVRLTGMFLITAGLVLIGVWGS